MSAPAVFALVVYGVGWIIATVIAAHKIDQPSDAAHDHRLDGFTVFCAFLLAWVWPAALLFSAWAWLLRRAAVGVPVEPKDAR